MAGIDKTYVSKEQFKKTVDWCKCLGIVKLENGHIFKLLDWCFGYNESLESVMNSDKDEFVLWNTPHWLDRWLWKNCPLDFIRDRLEAQYDKKSLENFENWKYDPQKYHGDGQQKYTFLKAPKGSGWKQVANNGRKKKYLGRILKPWPRNSWQPVYDIEIVKADKRYSWRDSLEYDRQTDSWLPTLGMLPTDGDFCGNGYTWQLHHKNVPTKKTILRQLRKWNLPSGYLVKIQNINYGINFEILVK